jgi:hypothetical protein
VFVHGRTTRLSEATAQDLLAAVREHTRVILPDAYRKRVHSASRGISQRLERIEIHSARVRSIQRGQRMVVRIEVDGEEAAQFLQFLRRK